MTELSTHVIGVETDKLAMFLARKPPAAIVFRVLLRALGTPQNICEYPKDEINDVHQTARQIVSSCDSWVKSGEKSFIGQWIGDGDKILDSINWRMNPEGGNHAAMWDGSPEQLIGAQQSQLASQQKLFLELVQVVLNNSQQQMQQIIDRNMYLEKQRIDTDKLREELLQMKADLQTETEDNPRTDKLIGMVQSLFEGQMKMGTDIQT